MSQAYTVVVPFGEYQAGDTIPLDEDVAAKLVDAGLVEEAEAHNVGAASEDEEVAPAGDDVKALASLQKKQHAAPLRRLK